MLSELRGISTARNVDSGAGSRPSADGGPNRAREHARLDGHVGVGRAGSHGRVGRAGSRGRCRWGFEGLEAVKALGSADADVTLIDRHNYHLFQPLSYQVATGSLSPGEIAVPLRWIFRGHRRVRVLMGEVTGFDLERREVAVDAGGRRARPYPRTIPYDTLIVAGGSSYAYFGHDESRSLALEVKSLDSALQVRGRILQAFEAAELENDPEARMSWLTFVVVGAGPTGVEMAGQIAELARDTLPAEFRDRPARRGRCCWSRWPTACSPRSHPRCRAVPRGRSSTSGHAAARPGRSQCNTGRTSDRRRRQDADPDEGRGVGGWRQRITARPSSGRRLRRRSRPRRPRGRRVDLTLPGCPEVLAIGDMVRVRDAPRASHTSYRDSRPSRCSRPLRRPPDRRAPRRPLDATVPLPRQGDAGDDRAGARGRRYQRTAPERFPGLDHLAGRAPVRPDRVRESRAGPAALGLPLLHPWAWHAPDHRGRRRAAPAAWPRRRPAAIPAAFAELTRCTELTRRRLSGNADDLKNAGARAVPQIRQCRLLLPEPPNPVLLPTDLPTYLPTYLTVIADTALRL